MMSERQGYIISDQFATYFLTLTVVGWVDLFTRKECKDIFIESLKYCIANKGLIVLGYVVMGSHIHLMASAKEDSTGLSAILRDLKKFTSKQLLKWTLDSGKESRSEWLEIIFRYHAKYNKNNKNYQIWQQNNQPKICLHQRFIRQKLNYIHMNPVVSAIVDQPEDYKYSSARNYLGRNDSLLEITLFDIGTEDGYVFH